MNEQKMNQLYVFKKQIIEGVNDHDSFESFSLDNDVFEDKSNFKFVQISRTRIRDLKMFEEDVCIDFHFFENDSGVID